MLLKLSKWCEILAFKLKSKSIYYELKYYLKRKKSHLIHIHYWERAMGKSYNLVKLALQNDMPIITPTCNMAKDLQSIAYKHFYPDKLIVYSSSDNLRGKIFNGVLVEEGLDDEVLLFLNAHCKFVVGYKLIERY